MFKPTDQAEVLLPCNDLQPALDFFVGELGFRIDVIFPADHPQVACISGHGVRLRLAPGEGDPGQLRLAVADPGEGRTLTAPNGTRIELVEADPPVVIPPLVPEFVLTRYGNDPTSGQGRAGMMYRDLIPGRLGGRFIASHISIPGGGVLSDWVHFHKIRFQMIFVRRGWVKVVYEDQGEPFVMQAGDCVLQPPRIRHRVLEASVGLEVVEIGCPALHETLADPEMELPTGRVLPDRDYGGQAFLRHIAADAPWAAFADGFERQDTGMLAATHGIGDCYILRPGASRDLSRPAHDGELMFGFVLEGTAVLERQGEHALSPADAFVIPAGEPWGLKDCSEDLRLLQVVVP